MFGEFFSGQGCAADGSIGSNPLVQLISTISDSVAGVDGGQASSYGGGDVRDDGSGFYLHPAAASDVSTMSAGLQYEGGIDAGPYYVSRTVSSRVGSCVMKLNICVAYVSRLTPALTTRKGFR
jgi:hypothetical protein